MIDLSVSGSTDTKVRNPLKLIPLQMRDYFSFYDQRFVIREAVALREVADAVDGFSPAGEYSRQPGCTLNGKPHAFGSKSRIRADIPVVLPPFEKCYVWGLWDSKHRIQKPQDAQLTRSVEKSSSARTTVSSGRESSV